MSIPLTVVGQTFEYPVNFDENWGIQATGWAQAVTNGMLQRSGGNFPLIGDVNFGGSFGLIASYFTSHTASPASAGILRLANVDAIEWRNAANTGNNVLSLSGDTILYNGGALALTNLTNSHIFVGNLSNTPTDVAMSGDVNITNTGVTTIQPAAVTGSKIASSTITEANIVPATITNVSINATAAIAVTKLAALTPSTAVATDGSGFLLSSSTTATELGYVHGVTSAIQTQINAIIAAGQFQSGDLKAAAYSSTPSGWLLCDGTSYPTATYPALFAAIGYAYGGSGANFNVPNLVNFVPVGQGGSIVGSLGATSGATTVTVVQNSHTHTDSGHQHATTSGNNGGATGFMDITHPYGTSSANHTWGDFGIADQAATSLAYDNTATSTANISTTTATNQPSSTVQPSLGVNWFIKT